MLLEVGDRCAQLALHVIRSDGRLGLDTSSQLDGRGASDGQFGVRVSQRVGGCGGPGRGLVCVPHRALEAVRDPPFVDLRVRESEVIGSRPGPDWI